MFGLMKQAPRGSGGDAKSVKGVTLGSASRSSSNGPLDAKTTALVALAAACFPPINGRTLASLERHFRLEPHQKPVLRRYIADSFQRPPAMAATLRDFKRAASPRHDDCHRLFTGLCQAAGAAGVFDARTVGNIIAAGKALGLNKEAVLKGLQKAGLTA